MAYIGLPPKANFTSGLLDRFTSTTGTTVTLTHDISSENDIVVFVNFVKQDSTTYSVGGTGNKTLTLGGTLVSSDIVEVHYLNIVGQTVAPSSGSVTTATINDNAVTGAKLNADVISSQTELASGVASTDELLISDAGVLKRVDVSLVGGDNKPSFLAKMSSHQGVSHNASVKVHFDTEVFDTDGCYDHSTNYRFTPTTAGKYLATLTLYLDSEGQGNMRIFTPRIAKNGTLYTQVGFDKATGYENNGIESVTTVVDMNGSSDYIEAYVYHFTQDNSSSNVGGSDTYSAMFTAHKLIGV